MFEPVNELSRRLPRPVWTGDPTNDRLAAEQHVANGRRLRSEAFLCLGRALIAYLRGSVQRIVGPLVGTPSHQV